MGNLFISYSSKDTSEVNSIVKVIRDYNHSCFIAPESIPNGSTYAHEVPGAIKDCDLYVIMVSKYSQESPWVKKEIECAKKNDKKILAIQISPTPLNPSYKLYLKDIKIISYHENADKVLKQLKTIIDIYIKNDGKQLTTEKVEAEKTIRIQ